jgi:hypothetical protein
MSNAATTFDEIRRAFRDQPPLVPIAPDDPSPSAAPLDKLG